MGIDFTGRQKESDLELRDPETAVDY